MAKTEGNTSIIQENDSSLIEISNLIQILKAEKLLYFKYLEKLNEQQECLINNNIKRLKIITENINSMAQKALALENKRQSVIESISSKYKIDPENITISNILKRFETKNINELENLRNTITETYEKINKQKTRNELLIDQSMKLISNTIDYVNSHNNPKVTYDNPIYKNSYTTDNEQVLARTV